MPFAVAYVAQGFAEKWPHNPKVVSDMTALHHIHEPSILFNLGERAKLDNQQPYTFMVGYGGGAGPMGGGWFFSRHARLTGMFKAH